MNTYIITTTTNDYVVEARNKNTALRAAIHEMDNSDYSNEVTEGLFKVVDNEVIPLHLHGTLSKPYKAI
jgi:hypothetical protein